MATAKSPYCARFDGLQHEAAAIAHLNNPIELGPSYWWLFLPIVALVLVRSIPRALILAVVLYAGAIVFSVVRANLTYNLHAPGAADVLLVDFIMLIYSGQIAFAVLVLRFIIGGIRARRRDRDPTGR